LTPPLSPSENLSLALSYKEREAEYLFLFGGALMLPLPCQKSEASLLLPHGTRSLASFVNCCIVYSKKCSSQSKLK